MKIKYVILLLIVLAGCEPAHAQYAENENPRRWFAGGNLGLQIGTVTLIDVSPLVGYMLTPKLAVGVGATYKYYHIRNYFYDPALNRYENFKSHIFGGSSFGRYFITPNIFAHTEYEYLRYNNQVFGNINFHSYFIGAGYRQFFSAGSAAEIMILWNLNETHNSPYSNPVIRMGFSIGF